MEVGKVAGNMKHRMVTIVPIHNVFKLMGARVIKGESFFNDVTIIWGKERES